jgi:hypothetical protein
MFAADTQISNARYLKTNPIDSKDIKTTSIVVSCSTADARKISSSIRLFSRARKANVMWLTSPSTQCKKCWQFGHATQGCTKLEPSVPSAPSFIPVPITNAPSPHARKGATLNQSLTAAKPTPAPVPIALATMLLPPQIARSTNKLSKKRKPSLQSPLNYLLLLRIQR